MLVCFEGINHAGKTSLATLLKDHLEEKEVKVHMFKYPKRMPDLTMPKEEIAAHFLAEMIKDAPIIEKLSETSLVVVSRWFYSTIAYQDVSQNIIKKNKFPVPNIVFLLDADPLDLADRVPEAEKDLYETDIDFQKTVREHYHRLMKTKPFGARWVVINALAPITDKLSKVLTTLGIER